MSTKINRIFLTLLAAGLLLTACEKKVEPFSGTFPVRHSSTSSSSRVPSDPIPEDPDPDPDPSTYPSLISTLDRKIAEYNKDENIPTNHVYICAHRANTAYGIANEIPENSIWAIETAIEKGADFVELDVAVTSDGVLMIMHDDYLKNTTDGTGYIYNKTAGEVKAMRMHARNKTSYKQHDGDYVRVPTLEEALAACRDKIYVNLDMKGRVFPVNDVIAAIEKTGTVGQVMIFSPGGGLETQKDYINKAYSRFKKQLAIHPYIGYASDIKAYMLRSFNGCAKLFQYDTNTYYNPSEGQERFGYQCHAQGGLSYSNSLSYDSQIAGWTSGSCTVLDRFIASGSDVVQTDYCEKADAYLKTKNLR